MIPSRHIFLWQIFLVHPCDREEPKKAGCEQKCEKKGVEAVCKCKEPEYKLASDKKKCIFG